MRKLDDREQLILLLALLAFFTGVARMAANRGAGPDVLPAELFLLFGGLLAVAVVAWSWKHNR